MANRDAGTNESLSIQQYLKSSSTNWLFLVGKQCCCHLCCCSNCNMRRLINCIIPFAVNQYYHHLRTGHNYHWDYYFWHNHRQRSHEAQ